MNEPLVNIMHELCHLSKHFINTLIYMILAHDHCHTGTVHFLFISSLIDDTKQVPHHCSIKSIC
ncbi:hypothetical protein FML45_09730 [Klebsiella variicola]|nr:hypothetical protein [Klebsiella variicola]MBZ7857139.1 hypothetical protein [Klebsiella variicola]MBZ7860608.1 hypothetical protein [Klebsiella variicola]HBY1618642.1 hypothetical protein [Klebsiella variicola]